MKNLGIAITEAVEMLVRSPTDLVEAAVASNKDKYVDLIRDLVRLSADGESAVQHRVADVLRDLGCEVDVIELSFSAVAVAGDQPELLAATVADDTPRANVVGTWRGSGGGGRSLILFAHADSPPVHGTENWRYPPFEAPLVDGQLYGWGVADDKSGIVAMIAAVDALREAGLRPAGDVVLVSCVSKNRTRGMAVALAQGVTADAAVYLHPAESRRGLREVKTATAGNLDFRITVEGQIPPTTEPRHTPFAHLGHNAVQKGVRIASALMELDEARAARLADPDFERYLGRSTNLLLGSMHGGEGHKRVPTRCVLECCLTFPASETVDTVRAEVGRCIADVVAADPWLQEHPPVVEWLEGTQPAGVPAHHPLVATVSRSIEAVTGASPEPYPGHAASDIRIPMCYADIPTVGYGPRSTEIAANGAPDESIDVGEFVDTIKATALVIADWCGTEA